MKTLWVFGDSFTEGYTNFVTKHPNGHRIEWRDKYINWKGYTPVVFNEILSDKLKIKSINKGTAGADNYTIFDSIIQSLEHIKEDDIIIIGWSTTSRFRLANKENEFESITMWWQNASNTALKRIGISQSTINHIMINRMINKPYINEINGYIKLLNNTFKSNKIIHWSPFYINKSMGLKVIDIPKLESILDETKGQIDDLHFSEPAHSELAEHFYHIIHNNDNTLI